MASESMAELEIEGFEEIFARLAAPFKLIKTRPKGNKTVEYIDSTMAMNRFDDVLGPANWEDKYKIIDSCVYCTIIITLPDGRKVRRGDASGYDIRREGQHTDQLNSVVKKSAFSDAFKRAALKFGVGRYLKNGGKFPSYYHRVYGRLKGTEPTGGATHAAPPTQPVAAPAPAAPPRVEEFPSRARGATLGAVLFRTLKNHPYGDSWVDDANAYGSARGWPELIREWSPAQCEEYRIAKGVGRLPGQRPTTPVHSQETGHTPGGTAS